MEEFLDDKIGNETPDEIAEIKTNISPHIIKENNLSPSRFGLPPDQINPKRDSFSSPSPFKKGFGLQNLRKDSSYPTQLNMNPTFIGRPSIAPHFVAGSQSYSIDVGLNDNNSAKNRVSVYKKKEFWRKSATRKKKQFENQSATYIAKILKKLRGLVRLKLNLSGFRFVFVNCLDLFLEIIWKMMESKNWEEAFQG